jgi:hypothetical protein
MIEVSDLGLGMDAVKSFQKDEGGNLGFVF